MLHYGKIDHLKKRLHNYFIYLMSLFKQIPHTNIQKIIKEWYKKSLGISTELVLYYIWYILPIMDNWKIVFLHYVLIQIIIMLLFNTVKILFQKMFSITVPVLMSLIGDLSRYSDNDYIGITCIYHF